MTVGLFISAFSTGFLSDIFGRRSVVLTACLLCASGILLQYFSQTIPMLFGGKLLSTFGFGLGHSLGPVFVAELAPTSLRGICLTLIVSTFYLLFSIVSTKLTVCNSEHHDRHRTVDLCIGSLWLLAPHHQFSMAYSYHHSAYSTRNSSSHRCPLSSRVSILASDERPTRRCSKVLSQIQRTKIRRRVSHCDHRRSNQSREAIERGSIILD